MEAKEYQDLTQRLAAMEKQVQRIEHSVCVPRWKKVLYGLGLAFLTASTARYWIDKVDKQQPPAYILPCVGAELEVPYAK
jgi:hypothetical protein